MIRSPGSVRPESAGPGSPGSLQPASPGVGQAGPASVLARFVRKVETGEAAGERCDLCDDPVGRGHRHLLEPETRSVHCVCLPCQVLFDRGTSITGRFRLIPDRRLALRPDVPSDDVWLELGIPVGVAFVTRSSTSDRVIAAYPSPAGPVESVLPTGVWEDVVAEEPLLAGLEPDTEALLVNRARGARQSFLVPIDDCFRIVAAVRTTWRGLAGGPAVWARIGELFDDLQRRARPPRSAATAHQEVSAP